MTPVQKRATRAIIVFMLAEVILVFMFGVIAFACWGLGLLCAVAITAWLEEEDRGR